MSEGWVESFLRCILVSFGRNVVPLKSISFVQYSAGVVLLNFSVLY